VCCQGVKQTRCLTIKKEVKVVNKIKRLLKRLGFPRWLHHFGPKTYEFYEHLVALITLIIKLFCKLSYRRTKHLLDLLGIGCPSKSALQYTANKLDSSFWKKILSATSGNSYLVALDSTGFSMENPSYYYLKRIDGKIPKIPVKLSCAFDTRKKKYRAAKVRVLPAHDVKDAESLLERSQPEIAVADKAYSSEKLYAFSEDNNILLMCPHKKGTFRGHCRKKMQKRFRTRIYHRRSIIESSFSSLKRKYGSSVSSKKASTIRTEVYGRLICHNLFYFIFRLLGQSLYKGNTYKSYLK